VDLFDKIKEVNFSQLFSCVTTLEDGVFPALLKNEIEIFIRPMTKIFVASIAQCYIPKPWRNVKTIIIPKQGRTSYESAKSYRLISFTSFFLKTLGRPVDQYIRTGPIKLNPLHDSEHAYQREKSCETALHDLVSRVETLKQRLIARFMPLAHFWTLEALSIIPLFEQ
jgi:hypothetical protein